MNLIELRTRATQISGRYDLADHTTFADTGMNYYINAGQRWLDRKYFGKRMEGRYPKTIDIGDYIVDIQLARSIKEVWFFNLESRTRLDKASISWIRQQYTDTQNLQEVGTPLYYAPMITRGIPHFSALSGSDADFRAHDADLMGVSSNLYDSIMIYPPTDAEITVEVWGLFYSNPLINDTDKSYWSETNPDILIHAALRAIEVDHRNRQGVDDWTAAIMNNLSDIQLDDLDEEITDIDEMEG